jgi:8-oxo-dGTP pyrophosphatase MutT (NUDIX family)
MKGKNVKIENIICNDDLLHHIRKNLKRFGIQTHDKEGYKRAAVAITVVDIQYDPGVYEIPYHEARAGHAALILTRRSPTLRKHAAQWALPGGRMDKGESAEETALRELQEEVGLALGEERIIGRLDDYSTRSGFTITPVVVWGGTGITLTANPGEVASIHRIPLAEFMRRDAPILESIPESDHPVLMMPVGNNFIAAPTAAMIYQFREVAILGKGKRVDHYEQPYFAWK